MKKQIAIFLLALLVGSIPFIINGCEDNKGSKEEKAVTTPISFAGSVDLSGTPKLDTVKIDSLNLIYAHVPKTTTVTWDSVYLVGYTITKTTPVPPKDTTITNPPTSYGTLIYSTGYDKTADIFNNANQQGNGGLSTTIYKTGPGSFKSVPANVSAGIRSEVQYSSSQTPSEGAIEYDVMYETAFQNNGHSLQFHPNTSGGSASPGLWHIDGKWVWVNWKGGTNTKYPTGVTILEGRWMHIVFQYKTGSSGYMKFTVDGKVLLDKTGIQVGDGSGQYLKVGVNMWQDQASVVYYDNLKIWKK